MSQQDRVTAYINSLDRGHGSLCARIAKEARAAYVPIIRSETAVFLQTMIQAAAPRRILEVGTAIGYSALLIAQVMPQDASIVTMERDAERASQARKNFEEAGVQDRICLLEGDADILLPELSETVDFLFMDAAKGQYVHWLPHILRLLAPGGILFSDNVLQDGDLIESRFAVERRNRTIHARMRNYLFTLTHSEKFQTSIIPIGDGVALSVRL